MEFEARGNKKYEVKAIIDSVVYSQQNNNQMPGLYYLVLWKGSLKEENTWDPSLVVIHLRKLISTFHKEHPKKPTATSLLLGFALLMAKPMFPKKPKQKRSHPNKRANKRGRK